MLRELVHDKINEVFLEYQKENHIISGDIDPFDALQLDLIERGLEELVERVGSYQEKEHSAFYTYRTDEGSVYTKSFEHISKDKFFTEVSNIIAFDDCTNYTVISICFDGKEVEYAGWQPCMKFEYKDLDGNTVWEGQFEHWDH